MLNFLEGKSSTVAMIDPNHVGKAIRSQLVLGGSFTTIGDTCFDVGLLQLAGVQQNLYQVDDFASDAVVLELCSTANIAKIEKIAAHEDQDSLLATITSLLFLRLFIVVSSSSIIPKRQGIAILWASMLYFTSINISQVTKRNIVGAVIPLICLIAQKEVKKIRLLTSEPAEHYFGCARQKKREFTISDFVMYVESLELAMRHMVQYNFRGGGGTGYISTFSSFLSQCIGNPNSPTSDPTNNNNKNISASFQGIEVDYHDSFNPVSKQIEEEVIKDINEATEVMTTFLVNGMKLGKTEISPFATIFDNMKSLACIYYFYLPGELQKEIQDHNYTNGNVPKEPPIHTVEDVDEENEETSLDTLEYACRQTIRDRIVSSANNANQFMPQALTTSPRSINNEVLLDSPWENLTQTMSFILNQRKDTNLFSNGMQQIFEGITKCIGGTRQVIQVSTNDAQKYNSLKGRWWGKSNKIDDYDVTDSSLVLKRGQLFLYNSKTYKVLNVFAKTYNKWRIEKCVNVKTISKVQAVAVVEKRLTEGTYEIDISCIKKQRFIDLKGKLVKPFAIIDSHGWVETGITP